MQPQNPFQSPSESGGPAPYAYDHFEIGPAISDAWSAASERAGSVILLTLLYLLSFIPGLLTLGILIPLFIYGYIKALLRVYDGEEPGSLWPGFSVFGVAFIGLVGIALVQAIPGQILMVPLFNVFGPGSLIPTYASMLVGFFVGAACLFAQYIIIDQDASPARALTDSWAHTKKQFGQAVGLAILVSFISSAGLILFGVGILFTMPLGTLTAIAAYRQLYPREQPYDGVEAAQLGEGFDPYRS